MGDIASLSVDVNHDRSAPAPSLEDRLFKEIRPYFVQGNVSIIAGVAKLIEAKKALKKTKESFVRLVERLGLDLDTVERQMKIARNPVLADSAHARNLPLSWMTLYTLAALQPKILEGYIADGTVHPDLTRKEAERLVRKGHGMNSEEARDQGAAEDRGGDHDAGHGVDQGDNDDHGDQGDRAEQKTKDPQPTLETNTVGPDSAGEIARKLARLEELERETVRQAREIIGYRSEIEELRAQLGPETNIRAQQRLFRQVVRALEKADTPGVLEKENRSLKQGAVTDLVELVRSAVRDGLKPERLDLVYHPELH